MNGRHCAFVEGDRQQVFAKPLVRGLDVALDGVQDGRMTDDPMEGRSTMPRSQTFAHRRGEPCPATNRMCPECGRVFDLLDEIDADEWAFGHDCEV